MIPYSEGQFAHGFVGMAGVLQTLIAATPPIVANTVRSCSLVAQQEATPAWSCGPDGQRSAMLTHLSSQVLDILMQGVADMPKDPATNVT